MVEIVQCPKKPTSLLELDMTYLHVGLDLNLEFEYVGGQFSFQTLTLKDETAQNLYACCVGVREMNALVISLTWRHVTDLLMASDGKMHLIVTLFRK